MPANPNYAEIGRAGRAAAEARDRPDRGQMYSQQRDQAAEQAAIAAMEAERFARASQARQMRAPYEVMRPGDSFLTNQINKVISAYGQPVYNQGEIVGAIGPARLPGLLGPIANFMGFRPQAYTGIPEFDPFDVTRGQYQTRGDGQQIVPAVSTPMGNTCPPGYEFDDTLQACIRVSPGLQPAPFTPMQYRLPETGLLDFPVSNMGATLI